MEELKRVKDEVERVREGARQVSQVMNEEVERVRKHGEEKIEKVKKQRDKLAKD